MCTGIRRRWLQPRCRAEPLLWVGPCGGNPPWGLLGTSAAWMPSPGPFRSPHQWSTYVGGSPVVPARSPMTSVVSGRLFSSTGFFPGMLGTGVGSSSGTHFPPESGPGPVLSSRWANWGGIRWDLPHPAPDNTSNRRSSWRFYLNIADRTW